MGVFQGDRITKVQSKNFKSIQLLVQEHNNKAAVNTIIDLIVLEVFTIATCTAMCANLQSVFKVINTFSVIPKDLKLLVSNMYFDGLWTVDAVSVCSFSVHIYALALSSLSVHYGRL